MYSKRIVAASKERLERSLGLRLREYSDTEINDFAYRLKDVDWDAAPTSQIIATLPSDVQSYILNELQLCKIDWEYWASRYARITDDKGRSVALKMWPSQQMLVEKIAGIEEAAWDAYMSDEKQEELECKISLILLKSRQVGGTIIGEILLSHLVLFFHHTRAVIGSDHPDNSLKLFRVFTNVVDGLPKWMCPEWSDRVKGTNMHFPLLNSDVIVGSGNQKTTLGQGMTVDGCHLTEVSTWAPGNADAIDADLKPAFYSSRKHHSLFIIESTAEGGDGNWFHDQYMAAQSGKSLFKNIFIGWFRCPDKFKMASEGIQISERAKRVCERIERENNLILTREQAAWYHIMRQDAEASGKVEIFLQEYPSSPEEAFQFGIKSVFSTEVIDKVRNGFREPVFVGDWNPKTKKFKQVHLDSWLIEDDIQKHTNRLVIWEMPPKGGGEIYIVGCDSSYGLDGGDSSAIEVVRVGNKYRPDEQVAEWKGNFKPADLADVLWNIGYLYTDKIAGLPAKLAIECNPGSPGGVPQTDLMRRGYPHFYIYKRPLKTGGGGWSKEVGWWTTTATRPVLTETGVSVIEKGDLVVNSPVTLSEMRTFVSKLSVSGVRHLAHADRKHDDTLFGLFIAYYVAHESDTRSIADERRRTKEFRTRPSEDVVQLRDMTSSWLPGQGMSWERQMERWEDSIDN